MATLPTPAGRAEHFPSLLIGKLLLDSSSARDCISADISEYQTQLALGFG
jgi:hypothetical protein